MRKVFLDDLPHSKSGKTVKWNECVGCKIPFIFDEYEGEIYIVGYESNSKNSKLTVLYEDFQHQIYTQVLTDCNLTFLINKGVRKLDNNDKHREFKWKFNVGDIIKDYNRNIKITNRRVLYDENNHITKLYQYYCYECGFDSKNCYINNVEENDFWSTEHSLFHDKCGCACCGGRVVKSDINSIAITDDWVLPYLKNKKDGYKYTRGSRTIVPIKCPNCGYEKTDSVTHIVFNKFSCPKCSDGFSYPNKFMFNLLEQIGIKFKSEYMPKWLKGKRFDFYIPSLKLIIEMDGGLGHGKKAIGNITPEQSLAIDNWKDEQATKHGLFVIRIDCDKSDMSYIKHNILSSALVKYFDLSKISWVDCDVYAKGSIYVNVVDYYNKTKDKTINIANKFGITQHTVIQYLKYANKNGLTYFNPKENMSKTQFQGLHVLQFDMFTLKKIAEYNSMIEAEKTTGISRSSIKRCCDRKLPIAGNFIWRFSDDTYDIPNWKIESLANMHQKMVIQYDLNMNRLNIFNNMVEASVQTGANKNSIRLCCNRIYKQVGGYIWRYIFDCRDVENKEYTYNPRTKGRVVIQYDYFYNRITSYISASEASDTIGISSSGIIECCNRKYKTMGGYIWRYEDDCEDMELKTFKVPDVFIIGQYKDDMTLLNTYKNLREAELCTNTNRICIGNCLNNKQKTAGGFIWKRIYESREAN